jgi:hypothetical protein
MNVSLVFKEQHQTHIHDPGSARYVRVNCVTRRAGARYAAPASQPMRFGHKAP